MTEEVKPVMPKRWVTEFQRLAKAEKLSPEDTRALLEAVKNEDVLALEQLPGMPAKIDTLLAGFMGGLEAKAETRTLAAMRPRPVAPAVPKVKVMTEPIGIGDIITTKIEPLGVPPTIGQVVGEGFLGKGDTLPAWKIRTAPGPRGLTAISKDAARLMVKKAKERPLEPPKPVAPAPAAAKEPWQMTQHEWVRRRLLEEANKGPFNQTRWRSIEKDAHKESVRRAFSEGKPVPPRVLVDYPDLAAQAAKAAPRAKAPSAAKPPSPIAPEVARAAALPETAPELGRPVTRPAPIVEPPVSPREPPKPPSFQGGPPVPPADPPDIPITPPTAGRLMPDLRPLEEVAAEVVPASNRIVAWLAGRTGINPSVLATEPVGKNLVGYYRLLSSQGEAVKFAQAVVYDSHMQRFTGRMGHILPLDKNGFIKGTGKMWHDVFSRPDSFAISKPGTPLRALIDDYHQVLREVDQIAIDMGAKPVPKRMQEEGWFYIPRNVKQIREVELRRPSSPRLQRFYDEATEGFGRGVRYETDPRESLGAYVRLRLQEGIDAQLSTALEPYSVVPSQLIPEPVRIRMEQAVKARVAAERAARQRIRDAATAKGKAIMPSTFQRKVALDPEVTTARVGYAKAKVTYTKAMEAARRAEVGPGKLFGRPEKEIPIGQWRNRFFPREQADKLREGIGFFGEQVGGPWYSQAFLRLANTTRMLKSVFDWAAPFVQGQPVLARSPLSWAKGTLRHYQAHFDPSVQARAIREFLPEFQWMVKNGVPIGDPEFFVAMQRGQGIGIGQLLEKLPKGSEFMGITRLAGRQSFGRFQAGYNTSLGMYRAYMLRASRKSWTAGDSELAAHLRNLTGGLDSRALGIGPSQRAVESVWVAFSPRLLRSTVALMSDAFRVFPALVTGRPPTQRQVEALRTLGSWAAGVHGLYVLSGLALGKDWDEIEQGLNPLNGKKYLSHNINGDWIGVGGQIRAFTQLIASLISTAAPGGKPLSDLYAMDMWDNPLLGFYRFRGAPGLNLAGGFLEAVTGGQADFVPFERIDSLPDLTLHLGRMSIPFTAEAVLEGQQAVTVGAAFGGARTSPPTKAELAPPPLRPPSMPRPVMPLPSRPVSPGSGSGWRPGR